MALVDQINSLATRVATEFKSIRASIPVAGTTGTTYAAGNDSRLSDQRVPTNLSVTDAKVSTTAAISADKLADGTTNKVFLATERTKLTGIATSATANATDASLRDRTTHTGTQSADTLTDGTTNKAFLATERTKLTGIATGATANSTDAQLRDRTTHTGIDPVDALPAGAMITIAKSGSTWPGVPTTRTDIIIVWKGADPSPSAVATRTLGQPGVLNNVDLRFVV